MEYGHSISARLLIGITTINEQSCMLSTFTLTLIFLLELQEVNGIKACLKISPISKSNAMCDNKQ